MLKRFAADKGDDSWKQQAKFLPATGKSVAVVGGGPAGLTCAYYLAKLGHEVTVLEALSEAGGMMRVGIPEYRLPRNILRDEIREIEAAGVEIRLNTRIESLGSLFKDGYQAVFLAIGAHEEMALSIEGEDLPGVIGCVEFLRSGLATPRVARSLRAPVGQESTQAPQNLQPASRSVPPPTGAIT
jgi:NADPH-dependent glutamate synthase beta subunit-like oxidoreductase